MPFLDSLFLLHNHIDMPFLSLDLLEQIFLYHALQIPSLKLLYIIPEPAFLIAAYPPFQKCGKTISPYYALIYMHVLH